jgi:ABC-type Zn uptake system ZnuABC Zn-binding protein ZnuA
MKGNTKQNNATSIENIKAKLQSAKEELKKRYGEAVGKIKEELRDEDESPKDAWDNLKSRF